jgi:hypothetical protein
MAFSWYKTTTELEIAIAEFVMLLVLDAATLLDIMVPFVNLVTQPCDACMDACNNGHFWMFHCSEVITKERKNANSGILT